MYRCPFCTFERTQKGDDPDFSHVQSMRELAVHIVYAHAEQFPELADTVSDEWVGRFPRSYPVGGQSDGG